MKFYSTAVSPVGDRGLVIVNPGNYGPLTAFDANTGDIKWSAGDGGTYTSPIIVDLAGALQVVTVTQQNVVGVSVDDGAILWQQPWPRETISAVTPILYNETIIVSSQNQGVMALKPTKRDNQWVADVV